MDRICNASKGSGKGWTIIDLLGMGWGRAWTMLEINKD